MKKRSRRKKRVDVSLTETATPLFLLNEHRQIEFFNAGLEQLTGWSASEVLGTVCRYHSDDPPSEDILDDESAERAAFAATLCPPPQLFASSEPTGSPTYLKHRDGASLPRLLNFFPLKDSDGNITHIIGIVTDLPAPVPTHVSPAQHLHAELAAVRAALRQRYGFSSFIAQSVFMQRAVAQINIASQVQSPVLIRGEPGTGREHVARLIHNESGHHLNAFVPVDCRTLPAREIKSLLKRLVEAQTSPPSLPSLRPGTVYLANVEAIPRDLQEQIVELWNPDTSDSLTNLRLMAGTAVGFSELLKAETLREDFYSLLTRLEIFLPPLRDRKGELDLLAQAFLEADNRTDTRQIGGFSQEVIDKFHDYRWPGNLDELQTVIAEARQQCQEAIIEIADLPFRFRTGLEAQQVGPPVSAPVRPLAETLAEFEIEQIRAALKQARDNKTLAAKLLGLTRPKLYRRMEALGIAEDEEQDR
ncbi:MAG: hypothetical protein Tsb009_25820 [Planctomycetaceae bacterium]